MAYDQISTLDRIKYNDEFKEDFERSQSFLKKTVRNDGLFSAGTIKWDVINPSDVALQRTRNGDIPESELEVSQVSATPVEVFKKYRIDSFSAFKTNPNVRAQQHKKVISSINKAIDQQIVDALDTTSVVVTPTLLSTLSAVLTWTTTLWNKDIPSDGNVWCVITPNAWAQMMRIVEFKSSDYIPFEDRPAKNGIAMSNQAMGYRRWMDVNWFSFTGLTGAGTATAKCYMYHSTTIGHQITGEPEVHPYYYERQDRWETWGKVGHATAICLPRGIAKLNHDDTASFTA